MPNVCCCGNDLPDRSPSRVLVTYKPCRCDVEVAGKGSRIGAEPIMTQGVSKEHFEQRRRLGLPLQTPMERSAKTKWT